MALTPIDPIHALQIQAGTLGRQTGHTFEAAITKSINDAKYPFTVGGGAASHVLVGEPGGLLLSYIGRKLGLTSIAHALAISTGALATSEEGKQWLSINGASVTRCKSDIVLTIDVGTGTKVTVGVSTKQCSNRTPTNAQLYFTTARGFSTLLANNAIPVTDVAIRALRQFCGDNGFRPSDSPSALVGRLSDPRRYFWEEIEPAGRVEWERTLANEQDKITRLLLQKAYLDDPFVPDYLLHKTKQSSAWTSTEVAIYSIDELVQLSKAYQGFATKPYSVKKGSYKDPAGIAHLAPRFGVVQMQRGGQKQHPEQLQFNLEAGYFYKISS